MNGPTLNFIAGVAVGIAIGALAAAAIAAELPVAPPAGELTPGPLHSSTNRAPDEAAAAIAPALPPPSGDALAGFLAPRETDLPAFVPSGVWIDAVALPLGMHETWGRSRGAAVGDPSALLLCTPEHVRAVVWRYRRGTGPRAVPLDLEHASATNAAYALMGRVVGAWFDETRGAVARIELTPAGLSAITNAAAPLRVSAQLRTVTSTNAAGDRISIPWSLRSVSLTRDPALPTPVLSASDLRPLAEISVYPRAQ